MVVLDTCAIIEAAKQFPSFSKIVFKQMSEGAYLLSISFAEIACKMKLGKLEMTISARELYQEYKKIDAIQLIDIGIEEWLDGIDLEWKENKDPADRTITAFAAKKHLAIVTSDEKIKRFYKKVIW